MPNKNRCKFAFHILGTAVFVAIMVFGQSSLAQSVCVKKTEAIAQGAIPIVPTEQELQQLRESMKKSNKSSSKNHKKNKKIAKIEAKYKRDSKNKITFKKYTPLYWDGFKSGAWILVNDVSGQRFFIQRSDVSTRLKCITSRVKRSRLREGPGPQFTPAETISRGDGFLDLGSEDGWIKIKSPTGKISWMNIDHLWRPAFLFNVNFDNERLSSGDNEP